jgi:hypothetical protein
MIGCDSVLVKSKLLRSIIEENNGLHRIGAKISARAADIDVFAAVLGGCGDGSRDW